MVENSTLELGTCGVCRKAGFLSPKAWVRRLPSRMEVRPCLGCAQRVPPLANDRAKDGNDELRLAGLHRVLAGEVWSLGSDIAWFRSPFFHETTGSTKVKRLPKPDPREEVRKFLESPYYARD